MVLCLRAYPEWAAELGKGSLRGSSAYLGAVTFQRRKRACV